MTSCDPEFYHDFYIENQCKDDIEINLYYSKRYAFPSSGRPDITNFLIKPHNNELIASESTIRVYDDIHYYFDSIVIKKNDEISRVDYLDYSRWGSKNKHKHHTISYLTVYPEDFEDE